VKGFLSRRGERAWVTTRTTVWSGVGIIGEGLRLRMLFEELAIYLTVEGHLVASRWTSGVSMTLPSRTP
jgi:hypothetical protein